MAKCYRLPPNPLNPEPVVAVPNGLNEEELGAARGVGVPTSGIVHGSPRLKASIQSLIPAEFTESA
jgi:hypothetical protein